MVRKINSTALPSLLDAGALSKDEILWAYNGLDSAVTLRVMQALTPLLSKSPHAQSSYAFVRQMQGPALDMMRRGVAINQKVRNDETERYLQIKTNAQALLDRLADSVWGPEEYEVKTKTLEAFTPVGKRGNSLAPRTRVVTTYCTETRPRGLNAGSPKAVIAFFTIALGLPEQFEIRKTSAGSERTPSANDKALRKWAGLLTRGPGVHPRDKSVPPVRLAAPFASLILTIRDADKMLGVLKSGLSRDGRMRCSYNIVGTENWRWSSSKNVEGTGTNLQNISEPQRRMFCADDGYILIDPDLEQAESRVVAAASWAYTGQDAYWQACLSADLHTTVVQMAYPEFDWTDDPSLNRAIAERWHPIVTKYTYRDVAKRIGHGSNNGGTPGGISQAVGIPAKVVEDFQSRYFTAFPEIALWHEWIVHEIVTKQCLTTPFNHLRWFFGRPWDSRTQNDAKAFIQQACVATVLNRVMYACWRRSLLPPHYLTEGGNYIGNPHFLPIQLLLQNHDAFVMQVPITFNLPSIIHEVSTEFDAIAIPFTHKSETRHLTIPGEFQTGYNWSKVDPDMHYFKDGNPDGLVKWRGADKRTRTTPARTSHSDWLQRPISRIF